MKFLIKFDKVNLGSLIYENSFDIIFLEWVSVCGIPVGCTVRIAPDFVNVVGFCDFWTFLEAEIFHWGGVWWQISRDARGLCEDRFGITEAVVPLDPEILHEVQVDQSELGLLVEHNRGDRLDVKELVT